MEAGQTEKSILLRKLTIYMYMESYEPPHEKLNKMTFVPSGLQLFIKCIGEDSDQTGLTAQVILLVLS